jgi:hypothetical protein
MVELGIVLVQILNHAEFLHGHKKDCISYLSEHPEVEELRMSLLKESENSPESYKRDMQLIERTYPVFFEYLKMEFE